MKTDHVLVVVCRRHPLSPVKLSSSPPLTPVTASRMSSSSSKHSTTGRRLTQPYTDYTFKLMKNLPVVDYSYGKHSCLALFELFDSKICYLVKVLAQFLTFAGKMAPNWHLTTLPKICIRLGVSKILISASSMDGALYVAKVMRTVCVYDSCFLKRNG